MRTTVTSLVLLNVSKSYFIISLVTIAHFHLVLKKKGSLRNVNNVCECTLTSWGKQSAHLLLRAILSGILERRGCLPLPRWPEESKQ